MPEDKQTSALGMIGLPDNGPDLLSEALGEGGKAGHSPFARVRDGAIDHIKELRERLSGDETPEPQEKEAEQEQEQEEKQEPAKEREQEQDQIPDYVHSLNQQQQIALEKAERLERHMMESERRQQEIIAQMQQRPQPQEEQEYIDPEIARLRNEVRQEVMQEVQRMHAPIIYNMAQDRYSAAINSVAKDYEHFDKYFPKDAVQNVFQNIVRQYGPEYASRINWQQEWTNAYMAADYKRLNAQIQKQEEKRQVAEHKQKSDREARKESLKLVPKASSQGGSPSRSSRVSEGRRDGTFRGVTRDLKSQFFGGM